MKKIEIFTDGSCLGNPGPGGYGVILRYKNNEKELSQGYHVTTNNRMELLAPIIALESLTEPCNCFLYTDSMYVQNGVTSWLSKWKKNGWKTANRKPVKNRDLWDRLDALLKRHKIQWFWVKGHSGHPENERCDILALTAANHPNLTDVGFSLNEDKHV